jgi:hypothetical protein
MDCTVFLVIVFQVADTYSASSGADALLILADGASGRFSDNSQTLHTFLK